MTIKGNIIESSNNIPKENAVIMLVRLSDSVLIDFTRTNKTGEFSITQPLDTVEIIISHHKNDDKIIFFFPSQNNKELILNNTILPDKSEKLEEVTIYAYKDPIFFRGDTLVFTADSFQTKQNAVVEDLLKKLPGIEVDKNGNISSQGREVNKVLVDGDEFFGSDPTIATKNLGAKSIESVEIYEEENTDSDETADETIQVMDLKLKENAKNGYFGRVSGASDFIDFYEGELLFNRFKNDFKLSVFSLGSNTPRANFGYGDIKKYGLSTDNGNFFGDNDRNWWGGSDGYNNNGIPKTIKTGIFYSDKINDKIDVGLNYTYNESELIAESNKNYLYLLSDSSYSVKDSSKLKRRTEDHLINGKIKIRADSLTEIEILPRFSTSRRIDTNVLNNTFLNSNLDFNSASIVNQNHINENSNFSTEIRIRRDFSKKNRLLKYSFKYDQSDNEEIQFNITENNYVNFNNDTIDQNLIFNSNSNKYQSQLLFREPITKKWGIDIEHLYKLNLGNQDMSTFNKNTLDGTYNELDSIFSNEFNNSKLTNRSGFFYSYKYKKDKLKIGGFIRNVQIQNKDYNDNFITPNLNFWDILPQLSYRHKFNNSQRFRFNYKTNSRQPSVNQLQPVLNNSNPNQIIEGNPELIPDYSHQFNASYNHWKGLSGSFIWSSLSHRIVQNPFSVAISYDSIGRTITKTVNISENNNIYSSLNFGGKVPIGNSPLGLNYRNFSNYNVTNNIISDFRNITTTLSQSNSIGFEWDSDSIFFEIGAEISYSNPTNSLSSIRSQPFFTQEYSLDAEIELPFNMMIWTESNYTINTQRSDGYNINFLIVNVGIEKRFTKKENLILSLEGFDILNQNIIAQRQIQNNVIIDNFTTIISRYFLARLTYRFNNNAKPKDESFK
ncbi:MAG: hypothetical protein CL846_09665 [Crocinitomicaceae bacterium]|nr:hypothetical protein [Crocinitomicaceae bacterium]